MQIDYKMTSEKDDEVHLLELALKTLSTRFDEFIGSCLDAGGKVVTPAKKDLMRARACLPPGCKHALGNKNH
jgi:hypothetical protein